MTDKSGGNGGLYVIVGALVVVVAVMFAIVSGHAPLLGDHQVDVRVDSPAHAPGH